MDSNKQNLINKILYRAQYRGTKEMDIFVSKFVNSIIDNLDHQELVSLDKLINFDDETLVNLSLGKNSKGILPLISRNSEMLCVGPEKNFIGRYLGWNEKSSLGLLNQKNLFSLPMGLSGALIARGING